MPSGTVVVFGGAGFIGSHLLRHLVASDRFETVISADIEAHPRFVVDGVDYRFADVREPIPTDIGQNVAEIYNLAAVHVTPGHAGWEYYWTNVLGALNVCAFARQQDCNRLAFTSSISVYGPSEDLKDESSALEPETDYGRSKLMAERIHQVWHSENPELRKLVIARPAVIYGYNERGNFTRMANALKRRMFVFPGRDDTIKACGYVEDIVRSFGFMFDQTDNAVVYNYAHVTRYSARDICSAMSAALGRKTRPPVMPMFVMNTAGWVFELAGKLGLRTSINRARIAKLSRSTNVYPRELERRGFSYRFNLDQALENWRRSSPSGTFD